MEPWGTPTLTILGKTFQNRPKLSVTETRRNKAKYPTWNSTRFEFAKKIRMPNLAKTLGYIKWCSWSSPRPIVNPRNSISTTVRRSAVDLENLKPYRISEKRPHLSRWSTMLLTVCSYNVTYAFQSESTLYSCLNVKELLALNRGKIWNLSDPVIQSYYLLVNLIIYNFFRDVTNHRKKTNRAVVFSSRPLTNILKYRNHRWNLPTIWKTIFLPTHMEEII